MLKKFSPTESWEALRIWHAACALVIAVLATLTRAPIFQLCDMLMIGFNIGSVTWITVFAIPMQARYNQAIGQIERFLASAIERRREHEEIALKANLPDSEQQEEEMP